MYIISHRANNNHGFKENSLEAIKEVLSKEYIDGVEIDVRLTKDKKIILHHGLIISKKGLINNLYFKEIKNDVNLLSEILKNIKTEKIILIDIKCELCDIDVFVSKLNKILKKYKYLNIYLCSFNFELIKKLKQTYNYKTGLIISNIMNKTKEINDFDFVLLNYKVEYKTSKQTMLWTINKKEIMDKYKNKKIYIITDKPYLVQKE